MQRKKRGLFDPKRLWMSMNRHVILTQKEIGHSKGRIKSQERDEGISERTLMPKRSRFNKPEGLKGLLLVCTMLFYIWTKASSCLRSMRTVFLKFTGKVKCELTASWISIRQITDPGWPLQAGAALTDVGCPDKERLVYFWHFKEALISSSVLREH